MIDLRPPYPWEEQPKKPKQESSAGISFFYLYFCKS